MVAGLGYGLAGISGSGHRHFQYGKTLCYTAFVTSAALAVICGLLSVILFYSKSIFTCTKEVVFLPLSYLSVSWISQKVVDKF